MTVRTDCAVSARSPLLPVAYTPLKLPFKSSCPLIASGESAFGHVSTLSPWLPASEIKQISFPPTLPLEYWLSSGEQLDPTFSNKVPELWAWRSLSSICSKSLINMKRHAQSYTGISRIKASTQASWLLIQCSFYCICLSTAPWGNTTYCKELWNYPWFHHWTAVWSVRPQSLLACVPPSVL